MTQVRSNDAHPYMAMSPPGVVAAMLEEIGVDDIEQLFEQIPAGHRISRPLDLPPALRAEAQLRRHVVLPAPGAEEAQMVRARVVPRE